MNKKAVIFASIILFSGILTSSLSVADPYYEHGSLVSNSGSGVKTFSITVHTDSFNITSIEKEATHKDIVVKDKNIDGEKAEIEFEMEDMKNNVYPINIIAHGGGGESQTFHTAVTVGLAKYNQVSNLEDDVEDLSDDLDSLNDEINDVSNNLNTEIDDMSDKIDEFEDDINNFKNMLDSLKKDGNQRESELTQMTSDLNELSVKLENLKKDLSETEDQVKSVKSRTATGRFISGASLSVGAFILIVLMLYLGLKKGLFKKLIQASQQQYKERVQKKQPWER